MRHGSVSSRCIPAANDGDLIAARLENHLTRTKRSFASVLEFSVESRSARQCPGIAAAGGQPGRQRPHRSP